MIPREIFREIIERAQKESHTFCLSVISEVFVVPALLVGALPVQRKWLDLALAFSKLLG